mmetsp:Transcript_34596/g.77663  ORF Transcript_34596/g.77663 Transcript_34596/m.77663 type:complete len:109 (+) Transcript_34596:144-470(+)
MRTGMRWFWFLLRSLVPGRRSSRGESKPLVKWGPILRRSHRPHNTQTDEQSKAAVSSTRKATDLTNQEAGRRRMLTGAGSASIGTTGKRKNSGSVGEEWCLFDSLVVE